MLTRLSAGEVPRKHHLQLKGPTGSLRHEECITTDGFEGPYTIAYHENRPHASVATSIESVWVAPATNEPSSLRRQHFGLAQWSQPGSPRVARTPVLANSQLVVSLLTPNQSDAAYFSNADGDDLYFIHHGAGVVRSPFGTLEFTQGDYVGIPKGIIHRFELEALPQRWFHVETAGRLDVPKQWRNERGQLRMDAPYCHRDFRTPTFEGPVDDGTRLLHIKRHQALHGRKLAHSPFDWVGYDGVLMPWAFSIKDFQPRVGLVHLPPTWHGTFACAGALICSFVPRPVDFHPESVPCPYPHSSVDVDEVIYYVSGQFTSRRGVGSGSITLHPRGMPHGPHPGAYEASIGSTKTEEMAVMIDVSEPLRVCDAAQPLADADYDASFG